MIKSVIHALAALLALILSAPPSPLKLHAGKQGGGTLGPSFPAPPSPVALNFCPPLPPPPQAVIEKSVVLGLATGTKKGSSALSDLVTSYASILASQVGGRRLICAGC